MRNLSTLLLLAALSACGGGGGSGSPAPPPAPSPSPTPTPTPTPVSGPAWSSFSRDAQHTAQSAVATSALTRILWQTPVDLAPQYGGGGQYLLTHYGSPVISSMNTVLVPVKAAAQGT